MKKILFFLGIGLFLTNTQAMEHPFSKTPEEIEKSYPKKPTAYDRLGLPNTATYQEINKAYYDLKAQYDPSRFIDADIITKYSIQEENKKLDSAYSILGNPGIRELYDQHGNKGIQSLNVWDHHKKYRKRKQKSQMRIFAKPPPKKRIKTDKNQVPLSYYLTY